MSQLLGKELPLGLLLRLGGAEIEAQEGKIIPIFTIDEDGWAHPALLSYYEVIAKSASTLDMALWKNSSSANFKTNYYLKGRVSELEYEMTGAAPVSRFRVALEQVIEDQEPNAEITTGLTYRRMAQRDPNDFAAKVFRLLRETLHEG